jgi:hypothetical protein
MPSENVLLLLFYRMRGFWKARTQFHPYVKLRIYSLSPTIGRTMTPLLFLIPPERASVWRVPAIMGAMVETTIFLRFVR